jgi:hypothetical protein
MQFKRMAIALLLVGALAAPAHAQSDGLDDPTVVQDDSTEVQPADTSTGAASPDDVATAPVAPVSTVPAFDPNHPCDQYVAILWLEERLNLLAQAGRAAVLSGHPENAPEGSLDPNWLRDQYSQLRLAEAPAHLAAWDAGCF